MMNEAEFRAILNSDMKLWDSAEDTDVTADSVTKVIDIPWGIGRQEIKLEGLVDGAARRSALAGFGDYIRSLVDEAIGEESVTARAKQSAAKNSERDGGEPASEMVSEGAPVFSEEAVETFNVFASGPEGVARRGSELRERIQNMEERLEDYRTELKGIEAYLEAINASAHKKTPEVNPASEDEGA